MLLSMTGFGRADVKTDEVAVSAEVAGVNGRYLDIIVKLPPEAAALEIGLKRLVRAKVSRGRVSVSVSAQRLGTAASRVMLDEDAAEQYVASSLALAKRLGLKNDLTLTSILNLPEVARAEEQREPDEKEREPIEKAVMHALEEFQSMRRAEGEALERDLLERVEGVRSALAEVDQRLPQLNREYMERLRQKMADIAADLSVKEERIAMEVAIMAERADVTEEVVRFKSHLDQFVGLIEGDGSIGRKLEFLVQEMNREANTIGAKNRDSKVVEHVLEIKAQLEKIREQVQNIE